MKFRENQSHVFFQMFRLYDIDHDKKISKEEMKNVINNLLQTFHNFKERQSKFMN